MGYVEWGAKGKPQFVKPEEAKRTTDQGLGFASTAQQHSRLVVRACTLVGPYTQGCCRAFGRAVGNTKESWTVSTDKKNQGAPNTVGPAANRVMLRP